MADEKKDEEAFKFGRKFGEPSDTYYATMFDEVGRGSNTIKRKDAAIRYLLNYETMVRQQEGEEMATMAHLRPCLERLKELAGISSSEPIALTQSISYVHLKKALDALDRMERRFSDPEQRELLTLDGQLMMILRLLTKGVTDETTSLLSWAEFVQCYKTCIQGMYTLQHLPVSSDMTSVTLRARARDRAMSMLALFEPASTELFTTSPGSSPSSSPSTSPQTSPRNLVNEESRRRDILVKRIHLSVTQLLVPLLAVLLVVVFGWTTWFVLRPIPLPRTMSPPIRPAYNTSPLSPTSVAAFAASQSTRLDPYVKTKPAPSSLVASQSLTRKGAVIHTHHYRMLDPKSVLSSHYVIPHRHSHVEVPLWLQAMGGAAVLPMLGPWLLPTLGSTLTTATITMVAGMGASLVLAASMAAQVLSWIQRQFSN